MLSHHANNTFLDSSVKRSSRGEVNIVPIYISPTLLTASAKLKDLPLKCHFSLLYTNPKLLVETRSAAPTSLQRSYERFTETSSSQLREILSTAFLPLAHLTVSKDIFGGHDMGGGLLLASTRLRSGMLPNMLR